MKAKIVEEKLKLAIRMGAGGDLTVKEAVRRACALDDQKVGGSELNVADSDQTETMGLPLGSSGEESKEGVKMCEPLEVKKKGNKKMKKKRKGDDAPKKKKRKRTEDESSGASDVQRKKKKVKKEGGRFHEDGDGKKLKKRMRNKMKENSTGIVDRKEKTDKNPKNKSSSDQTLAIEDASQEGELPKRRKRKRSPSPIPTETRMRKQIKRGNA